MDRTEQDLKLPIMAGRNDFYGKTDQLQDGHFLCRRLKRSQSQTTHLRISLNSHQYSPDHLCRDKVLEVFEWNAHGKLRHFQALQRISPSLKHLPYQLLQLQNQTKQVISFTYKHNFLSSWFLFFLFFPFFLISTSFIALFIFLFIRYNYHHKNSLHA